MEQLPSNTVLDSLIQSQDVQAIVAMNRRSFILGALFKRMAVTKNESLSTLVSKLMVSNPSVLTLAVFEAIKGRSVRLLDSLMKLSNVTIFETLSDEFMESMRLGNIDGGMITELLSHILLNLPDTSYGLDIIPGQETYDTAKYLIDVMILNDIKTRQQIIDSLYIFAHAMIPPDNSDSWISMKMIARAIVDSLKIEGG